MGSPSSPISFEVTGPRNTVAAAGWGGSLTAIIVWILKGRGVTVPPEIIAAGTVVLTGIAGFFTHLPPDR